ncbi:hypothetical protein NEF87_003832 [Candidatus Lokiarchaeum ossiferum]|uniref:DZANK-type domain-containing protein n=1 Tax=Candidatus Lokiarchaeum ossiferum TaxID=2951803 RepID=A0ABY6HXH1_9ARCH|nr:hypothetical protein NEF87_003832 [Candidatus Lokiarchaeum sp. B-35]
MTEEENAAQKAAEEEAAKKAAEEEAAKKAAEEEAAKKAAEEEAAKKAAAEDAAKKAAEEEAAQKAAEEEAAKKAAEEEAAKKAAEEEAAKKAAEEEAAKKAKDKKKQEEDKDNLKFCMGTSDLLFKVLKAIDFKGGECSVSSLTVALMLDEKVFIDGLKTGLMLNLLEKDGDIFATTDLGDRLLSLSSVEQKSLIAKEFLKIESYRDIVFRMKMATGKEIQIKELEKAIYIILPNIREEIRKQITSAFINFAKYANIIEELAHAGNPSVKLTTNGESQLDAVLQERKRKKKGGASSGPSSSSAPAIVSDLSCQSCGKPIMSDYNMCPYCGTALKRSCSNCGKELQPGWKMCPFCGTAQ